MCGVYVFDTLNLVIKNIRNNTVFCIIHENQVLENTEFVDVYSIEFNNWVKVFKNG